MADFSQKTITGSVPVYELEFTMDGGSLWREIDELEEMLYGRVDEMITNRLVQADNVISRRIGDEIVLIKR